ncbi:MAG: alpha-E domain-containing protein [Thiotrichaceae bacterium]|nr:alpha-E domain-containing protein [Thiotrichaceae bacterium]
MLSRVARNVYWLGRYVERAENTGRLINVNSNLLLDLPTSLTLGWQPLIAIMGSEELFNTYDIEANERNITKFLMLDPRNSSSILSAVAQARENMRTTRDIVPADVWEQLNDLYLYVNEQAEQGVTKRGRYEFLKKVILGCQMVTGVTSGTMSRDSAYNFLRMGSFLERADMTSRILDVRTADLWQKHGHVNLTPFENIQWMSVLKSLTAYQMYRQHVRLRVRGEDVVKFLLQNKEFPRSMYYSLSVVERCLFNLPKNDAPLRNLARIQRKVQSANVQQILSDGKLHEFVDELQIALQTVHNHIATAYFGNDDVANNPA